MVLTFLAAQLNIVSRLMMIRMSIEVGPTIGISVTNTMVQVVKKVPNPQ